MPYKKYFPNFYQYLSDQHQYNRWKKEELAQLEKEQEKDQKTYRIKSHVVKQKEPNILDSPKKQRNWIINELFKKGWTIKTISNIFDLTRQQVDNILKK